jgi:hypothetical protein
MKLLHEPLVHFLVIGAALFALYLLSLPILKNRFYRIGRITSARY